MHRFILFVELCLSAALIGCGGSTQQPVDDLGTLSEQDSNLIAVDETTKAPPREQAIGPRDRRGGGMVRVKELKVAPAIEVGTNNVIGPQESFRRGIKEIYASFFLSGFEKGGTLRVVWHRKEDVIEEQDIESEGDKRYAVSLKDDKGIPDGEYNVEVEVLGEIYGGRTFHVGKDNISPVVEHAALGMRLSKNQMPAKEMDVFKTDTQAIHCGVRFLGLPDEAKVAVDWISFKDQGEERLDTSDTDVKGGGTANVGVTWKPKASLSPGQYKAVISLNGQKMYELAFTIQ